jgi:hypothetical protein
VIAATVFCLGLFAVQAPAAPPVPPPPVAAATAAVAPGDLWLVIYSVLPDRTGEFEAIARQVRDALAKSPQDVRQAQARDLRVHRSALPNVEGKVMYFLQIPALTGDADRSGFDVLIDAVLPEQASALKKQLASALDPTNPSGNTYLINVR